MRSYATYAGGLITLTKKEPEERAKGYAIIVDGRIIQVICEECRKRFWKWMDERVIEEFRRMMDFGRVLGLGTRERIA